MAWIKTVSDDQATGLLARVYASARTRAGRVFNILRVQSTNPRTLRASMGLSREINLASSPVPRVVREMIAVVVSRTNNCHY
jgi:alkylhydroperoxidase family enzyme